MVDRLKIVSYNTRGHHLHREADWAERQENFINDIVVPERPDIIGLQEVILHWVGKVAKKVFIKNIIERTQQRTNGELVYCVANALRCLYDSTPGNNGWEGDAVLYNPKTVHLIPFRGNWGEKNWDQVNLMQARTETYTRKRRSGFLWTSTGYTHTSKAEFEFPVGSNYRFLFFNVHTDYKNKKLSAHAYNVEAIKYVEQEHNGLGGAERFPPIFAGDFNDSTVNDGNFQDPFDASIDKVLIGQAARFTYTRKDWRMIQCKKFSNRDDRIYSDHPVIMVEIEAIDLPQDLWCPPDPPSPRPPNPPPACPHNPYTGCPPLPPDYPGGCPPNPYAVPFLAPAPAPFTVMHAPGLLRAVAAPALATFDPELQRCD